MKILMEIMCHFDMPSLSDSKHVSRDVESSTATREVVGQSHTNTLMSHRGLHHHLKDLTKKSE
jgi:hypothetical protein